MRRRDFFALVGTAIAWPLRSYAQQLQSESQKRIGILATGECPALLFRPNTSWSRRFTELGWIEGRDFVVECVSTAGLLDQLPALASELVARRPDVLIAYPSYFIRALKQATTTIPIVMLGTPDPIRGNIVTNLARPEGNITGVSWFGYDIFPKRIELLKEMLPNLRRLAIVAAAGYSGDQKAVEILEENARIAASNLGFAWQRFRPVVANDFDEIFAHISAEHFDAAYIQSTPLSNQPENVTRISQLALRHSIPTIGESRMLAKAGFLLSYSQDSEWSVARASEYVDKILRGARPSELPVEQANELQLVINLKTAKALGFTVPPSLISRADEVIE